jgi:hypothetical protein
VNAATAEDYRAFVASLPEEQRALALAAGLDAPPEDGELRSGGGVPIRPTDGLDLFKLNGAAKAVRPREPDQDEEEDPVPPFREDLGEALRAVLGWVLRGVTVETLFRKPQAVMVRLFALARLLRMNDFAEPSLAGVADIAGLTRAALSKAGCEIRDAVGQKFFCAPGDREGYRGQARRVALRSWARKREKDLSQLSQTSAILGELSETDGNR